MASNDWDDRAGLRGYVQFNKNTQTPSGHFARRFLPAWPLQANFSASLRGHTLHPWASTRVQREVKSERCM